MATTEHHKNLKVVCFNMHGFHQGCPTIEDIITDQKPNIIILQEHWLTPTNLHNFDDHFPDYFAFRCSAMSRCLELGMLRGRPFGGIITLVNNDLRRVTETIYCEERFNVIRVGNYLFVNVYFPCIGTNDRELICENMLHAISAWHERFIDCELVIAGDFNVSLDRSCDPVAKSLSYFMHGNGLIRCDDLFPNQKLATYVNEALRQTSQIDFVLTSKNVDVASFCVSDPDINFSDRLPLLATICVSLQPHKNDPVATDKANKQYHVKSLRWNKADLPGYYYFTGTILNPILTRVNKLWSKFDLTTVTVM